MPVTATSVAAEQVARGQLVDQRQRERQPGGRPADLAGVDVDLERQRTDRGVEGDEPDDRLCPGRSGDADQLDVDGRPRRRPARSTVIDDRVARLACRRARRRGRRPCRSACRRPRRACRRPRAASAPGRTGARSSPTSRHRNCSTCTGPGRSRLVARPGRATYWATCDDVRIICRADRALLRRRLRCRTSPRRSRKSTSGSSSATQPAEHRLRRLGTVTKKTRPSGSVSTATSAPRSRVRHPVGDRLARSRDDGVRGRLARPPCRRDRRPCRRRAAPAAARRRRSRRGPRWRRRRAGSPSTGRATRRRGVAVPADCRRHAAGGVINVCGRVSVNDLTIRVAVIAGLAIVALVLTGWRKTARATPKTSRGRRRRRAGCRSR